MRVSVQLGVNSVFHFYGSSIRGFTMVVTLFMYTEPSKQVFESFYYFCAFLQLRRVNFSIRRFKTITYEIL